jgi:hypothetical protein
VDHRGFDFFGGHNREGPNKESNLLVRFATCHLGFVKAAAFIKLEGKRGLAQVVGDMLFAVLLN